MKTETIVLCVVVLAAHSLLVLADCKVGGKVYKAGEKFSTPGVCQESTCQPTGRVTNKGCSLGPSLKPCQIVEDSHKPYPLCCPRYDCEKNLRL